MHTRPAPTTNSPSHPLAGDATLGRSPSPFPPGPESGSCVCVAGPAPIGDTGLLVGSPRPPRRAVGFPASGRGDDGLLPRTLSASGLRLSAGTEGASGPANVPLPDGSS